MTQATNVVSTDKVIGVKVKNPASETLGKIDKLLIDKVTGHVYYAALGVGGFLGIAEKHIAIPWNALNYDASQECYILNADKEKLKNAKALEEGWSDWSNEAWAKDIYQEFGTRPYWEDKKTPYK